MTARRTFSATIRATVRPLNGIYQQMASSLYGRELSWGFVSALRSTISVRWMLRQIYAYTEKMDYENKEVLRRNHLADRLYAIANCNALISHVEKADPDLPTAEAASGVVIYGEALAARALLHFELLRLFAAAAAPVVDLTAKATLFDDLSRQGSVALYDRGGARKIIADFEAALPLLAVNDLNLDALKTAFMRFASGRFAVWSSASAALHYWAVKALLARVYMYACDYRRLCAATEVYDACSSWFINTTKAERRMSAAP